MATKKEYSVLTYNIGGYERMHHINKRSDKAEYIYVTDDRSIKSDEWEVIYVDNPYDDPFELCYQIRFNPFKYCNTDICIRIDGSMGIDGDLDRIIDKFNEGGYDLCVMVHPTRNTMYDEYVAWCKFRGYDVEQANKCLTYMNYLEGYDVKERKGLYQFNFMVMRNNRMNGDWMRMTYSTLKYLAAEGKMIERVDQTIGSFILNKYFDSSKVMCVNERICNGSYFTWYGHNSDTKLLVCEKTIEPYLFNKPVVISDI